VVERLRDLIIQGELAPGLKLNERLLCERLRTSRTPVREAIKYLASEGLVELLPNRGAIVTPITVTTVREMFVLLGALESLAGELACVNASDADIAEIRALPLPDAGAPCPRRTRPLFPLQSADPPAPGRMRRQRHAQQHLPRPEQPRAPRALHGQSLARALDHAVEEHQKILDALARRDGVLLPALLRKPPRNKMLVVLEALGQQAEQVM